MKKFITILLAVIIVVSLVAISCAPTPAPAPSPAPVPSPSPAPSPAPSPKPSPTTAPSPTTQPTTADKPINLVFSTWTPTMSADTDKSKAYMQKVEELSKGRVKFTFYSGAALGGPREHYDLAVNGVADITFFAFASVLGRFLFADADQFPFIIPSSAAGTYSFIQAYKEFPEFQKELGQVKVLGLGNNGPFHVYTSKRVKPVEKLEDLKGVKIRTSGPEAATAAALGGTSVSIVDMAEVYLALERGVVDGIFMGWQGVSSFRYYEVLGAYTTWKSSGIRMIPWGMFMNLDKFKSMPPDIQDILVKQAGIEGNWFGPATNKIEEDWSARGRQAAEKAGGKFIQLTDEETARWAEKVTPVREKGAKDMDAKGLPGTKFVNRLFELVKEYEKNPYK